MRPFRAVRRVRSGARYPLQVIVSAGRRVAVAVAGALLVAGEPLQPAEGLDPFWALLFAAAAVVALAIASARNPLTKCWRCGGTGRLRSWLLPWRFRPCARCGRSGEVRGRFGRKT